MIKSNIKTILIASITLIIGLVLGFLLFGRNNSSNTLPDGHEHSGTIVPVAAEAQIWTCSMHPQIRQNEPGDCPLCGMDLIPLEEGGTSDDPLVLQMTEQAVKLACIETTIVGQSKHNGEGKSIQLSGKVQADERLASSQVAHIPGRIEKLYVTFTGEQVNRGQKLATIYSPELITAQRELIEALKLKDVNPGLVEAARNKLRFWKISAQTIEEIEKKGEVQETFTIYADESGIVTTRRVAVGDYLKQGEPLFDLMNLRKVWVLFDAYEEDLRNISLGDKIAFITSSVPNKTFETRVTFIDPVINAQTRVASIRTEISNPRGTLKPEMLVYGTLSNKVSTKETLTVPKSAVLWTGTRSVIYVKVPDMMIPSFQFREVELGEELGDSYGILEGLEAGEEVVTYGSFSIDAAAQLNNQASMMNKDVKMKGGGDGQQLPDFTEVTPLEFKQQLATLSEAYLSLKDAFVATDENMAKQAAQKVTEELPNIDMSLLEGDAHMYWMEQLSGLQAHSEKITEFLDIEEQRKQFDFLSQALIKSIKVFGIPEDTYYVQHCPMAFDNVGADWISDISEIQNPYFGNKMLTCGTVKDTITKDFKNPQMKQSSNSAPRGHNH